MCPLLTRVFSFFLLGDPQESFPLRQQLETLLLDPSAPPSLSAAVLRLAELLLFCADSIALETLVWSHFPPPSSSPSSPPPPYRSSALRATQHAWRSLLPSPLSAEDAALAESAYRTDAEARLRVLQSQHTEAQSPIVRVLPNNCTKCTLPSLTLAKYGVSSAKPPGPLVTAVLAKVARWPDLEMDDYVTLTSICSVLAAHPHPSVHSLLVDSAGALYSALKQVWLAFFLSIDL